VPPISNPRNWWHAVKQITGHKQRSTEPLVGLAQLLHYCDIHALADHINKFFQQVAADLHPLSDSTTPPPLDVSLSQFIIKRLDVKRKLNQINIYKAPGPDGLPNWIFDFSTQLSLPVFAIFDASVREGTMSARWKEINVIPGPKAHPPQLIESDLRPISLTATLSKLLESFVSSWILDRIQDKLDVRQYGALKCRSTTHALVDMQISGIRLSTRVSPCEQSSLTLPRRWTMSTTTS